MPWTTLATLNLEAITAAVNRVFESFTAPTWLSVEQMGAHLADNQVVLAPMREAPHCSAAQCRDELHP
jgi:hypothetical protein